MKNIIIVGAGASGMMAAISASIEAEMSGIDARIMILEHETVVGRKILVTGNGKCNISNKDLDIKNFHSSNESFPRLILEQFNGIQTETFFNKLGIYFKNRNGYLYPNSGQASTVTDLLYNELERRGIVLHLNTHVSNILVEETGFKVMTGSFYTYNADAVILTSGSPAGGVSGADASGHAMARKLGHNIIPVLPSLVQLRAHDTAFSALAGIRIDGCVTLCGNGREYQRECGEIQLTEYGISGIPVFQLSGTCGELLEKGKTVTASIDFMPGLSDEELKSYLEERARLLGYKRVLKFLQGFLPDKLGEIILKKSGINIKQDVCYLCDEEFDMLVDQIKNYTIEIYATNPLKHAQVARGGIDTLEINNKTMESLVVPGLFLAGEVVDVDGRCGGYNLQWAWSSGYVAGRNAVNYDKNQSAEI